MILKTVAIESKQINVLNFAAIMKKYCHKKQSPLGSNKHYFWINPLQ